MTTPRAALWTLVALAACGPSPAPAPAPVPGPAPVFAGPGFGQNEMRVGIVHGPGDPGPPRPPVEKGACEVVALLLNADTDSPVNATISLWRVGLPEDASWTAGDQCYGGPATTLEGSIRFEEIPPGRYRIACMGQRAGAEDGAEFVVVRGEKRVEVVLQPARTFRARMRVVDPAGRPVASVERESALHDGSADKDQAPEWVRPRTQKAAGDAQPRRVPERTAAKSLPAAGTLATDAGYFVLCSYTETARNARDRWDEEIRPPGCATIRAVVESDDATDETFAGLAVPLDTLLAHVSRPDGTRVTPKDADVRAAGDAVRCAGDAPPGAERASVFHVTVDAPGFAPLEFDWSLDTADAAHVLRPAGPK